MRRKRRIIIGFVFVGLVAAGALWFTGRSNVTEANYLTTPVTNSEILNTVSTTGSIVDQYTYLIDTSSAMVLTKISGVATTSGTTATKPNDDWTLQRIVRNEGATVRKGQTILTLRNFDGSTKNIVAPNRGQVLSINAIEGFSVSGNLVRMGTGRILVSVSVTESQLNSFTPNQPVAIAVNSSDETTYGSVIFVSPTSNSQSSSTATYQVLIQVAPGVFPEGIKSGMTATVEFPISDDDDIRYTNAKFIYEYEFNLNVDNEASLASKNGSSVVSSVSAVTNLDSWTVQSLPVSVGMYLNAGDTVAVLRNFDGTTKDVITKESGFVRDVFTAPNALVAGSIIELGVGPVLAAVEVSEFDIGQVEVGKSAVFTTSDRSAENQAQVAAISAKAIVDNSAVAKFKVFLEPRENVENLRIGSSVRANIVLDSKNVQIAIPIQALKQDADAYYVEVLGASGEPIRKNVEIGIIGDQLVEIISGLQTEELVIIGNRAAQNELPTQPTGPFGEGDDNSSNNDPAPTE